jgi:hypothetical protein
VTNSIIYDSDIQGDDDIDRETPTPTPRLQPTSAQMYSQITPPISALQEISKKLDGKSVAENRPSVSRKSRNVKNDGPNKSATNDDIEELLSNAT